MCAESLEAEGELCKNCGLLGKGVRYRSGPRTDVSRCGRWFGCVDRHINAFRDRRVGHGGDRGVGDRRLRWHVDGGAGESRSNELAGYQDRPDNEGKRKQHYERPPDEDPTRHGSDPSRPIPSDSLYLDPASFAALWPGIEVRLHRRLVRDGFDPDTARDLCQDVATAFLRSPQRVHTREELADRVLLAGYRLSQRRRQREAREQLGDLPDLAAPDVADEVERRFVVEAMVDAVDALPDRDRLVLLQGSAPAELSAIERNRFYVRLHRARRRLRDRLRGWLVGVCTGRYLPLRDDLLTEGTLRAICYSAAALVVVGTSILHNGTSQPAAAAPVAKQNVGARAGTDPSAVLVGVPRTEPPVAHPRNGRSAPTRPERSEASGATGTLEHQRQSQSVTVVGAPVVRQADAALNPRPSGDDSLVCLSGLRVAPDFCIQHPLRKDGESLLPHP